jgi:PGF-CTERM protein
MTGTTRTVLVAGLVALAVLTGAALAAPGTTTTTTDEQANETASVTAPDQHLEGDALTIDSVSLPDGGFAVVYNQSGAQIGHTDYLNASEHENLTVSLNESVEKAQVLVVTAVRNNGSESFNASADKVPYVGDGGANVTDTSYVFLQERGERSTTEETTEMTTETPEETTETTNESAMSDDATETTTDSSGGVPGFGVSTALVALVAAALVVLRRD